MIKNTKAKRSDEKAPILFRMRDFYADFSRKSIGIYLLVQLTIIILSMSIFILGVPLLSVKDLAIVLTAFIMFSEFISSLLFIAFILRPLKITSKIIDSNDAGSTEVINLEDKFFSRMCMTDFSKKLKDSICVQGNFAKNSADSSQESSEKLNALQQLFENLPVGVIAMNRAGKIIFSNSNAPISGDNNIALDFSDKNESIESFLNNANDNEIHKEKSWFRVQDRPQKNAAEDSNRRIFDAIISYHRDSPGGIDVLLVTADRTQYYQQDEENMDFLALAAHELRNPITVIRGYLDILASQIPSQTEQQREIFDRLNVSAKRLASYISNILNASHYDRQHMKLNLKENPVSVLLNDVREDMDLRARTSGRKLKIEIPDNLPTVAADRSSISEVLSNLIDNAIKYSHDGGTVEVSAGVNGDFVAISIRDHGVGIPDNIAQHLFDKFYRSHRSSGVVSGSGLGLYLSRAIVESHGGHISMKSIQDQGTIFTFMLPIFANVANEIADGNSKLIRKDKPKIENHGFIEN